MQASEQRMAIPESEQSMSGSCNAHPSSHHTISCGVLLPSINSLLFAEISH
jgi:hypothetical protein